MTAVESPTPWHQLGVLWPIERCGGARSTQGRARRGVEGKRSEKWPTPPTGNGSRRRDRPSRPGERQAGSRDPEAAGGGRGKETPGLIVVTEEAWRELEWTCKGRLREAANRKHEGST